MMENPRLTVLDGFKEGAKIRINPPFRSAPKTFVGVPEVDPRQVPFIIPVKTNTDKFPLFSVYPSYDMKDSNGNQIDLLYADSMRIDV